MTDFSTSRRKAISVMGATVTPGLLVAGGAVAQTQVPTQRSSMSDPRFIHPRPPFEKQSQPWPGLAKNMVPVPDHGETSYVGSGRLAGRKAFITGGDSGIGRAAAIAFAREGADVAIGYLPQEEEDAKDVIKLIRAAGRKAVALPGDIRTEEVCRKLLADAVKQLGGLDILVNNAARQTAQKSISDITSEQFDSTMKTNLYAMFWLSKAAVEVMPPGAVILNTASEVAYDPPDELLDYSATKAGIVIFTKALAKQVASKGIRVNAVAPGPFWTPLQTSGGASPEKLVKFGSDKPLGRPGQPAEIAGIFVLLASQDASYTTGNVYGSTGGLSGP